MEDLEQLKVFKAERKSPRNFTSYKPQKSKKGKTIILKPIEEDQDESHVSKLAYKCVFQRCHDDIKYMPISKDKKSTKDFF